MGKYRYLAYDSAGRRLSSTVAAASYEQVRDMLWADGLHIVDIRSRQLRLPRPEELFPTFIKVPRSEVILFTRQLATFVRVGIPILDGLATLRDQASSAQLRRALGQMLADLGTGNPLSTALSRHPRIFSRLYVDMVRSAEVSGNLDETLRQLASYMSRDESALRKVRSAMIYPAIVCTLALGVISVLVGFVLPAFARLFADFRATMPLPTRVLLAVGNFCRDHMLVIFLAMAFLVVAAYVFTQTPQGRALRDSVMLRFPVLGTIFRYAIIERYLRTLSTLARAGVPVTQMIDTANSSIGNVHYQAGLQDVRAQMLSGEGFAGPLARTGLFPKLVIQMVRVGEETGNLDVNLEEAAEHYAEEVDYRLKQMITLLEPALVIVVGAMVAFIAISVIAPMYSLVHAVH